MSREWTSTDELLLTRLSLLDMFSKYYKKKGGGIQTGKEARLKNLLRARVQIPGLIQKSGYGDTHILSQHWDDRDKRTSRTP